MAATDAAFLLAPQDNVAVARRAIAAGERVTIGACAVVAERAVAVGHKLAVTPIAPGEPIVKYNCPIGRATRAIAPGEYVHTHNLASDWLASTLLPDDTK